MAVGIVAICFVCFYLCEVFLCCFDGLFCCRLVLCVADYFVVCCLGTGYLILILFVGVC